MARRLVLRGDGRRNEWLTLVLLLAPLSARAFDGSVSLELNGGNRTLSGSLIGDWGIVPDKLYLVTSYGFVRTQPTLLPAEQTDVNGNGVLDPARSIISSPTHLFGVGLDWIPSMHWMTSLTGSFSPKALDTDTTNGFTVVSERRSVQGIASAGYGSNGLGDVEWMADATAAVSWYELLTKLGQRFQQTEQLVVVKPGASVTLSFFGKTDVTLKGAYSAYTKDPTTAGAVDAETIRSEICAGRPVLCELVTAAQVRDQNEFQQIVLQAQSNGVFSAAPPWFDVRVAVLHRFGTRVTGRFGYSFVRYVHGLGNAHAISTKWSFKPTGWARLWAGVTIQYDWLTRQPSFWSGYGTLGFELATE